MENKEIESCISACEKCVDICESCSTGNKGKPGMEHSVELCIACKDACNELIIASRINAVDLDALCKKCEAACIDCATECLKYIDMDHCRKCAEVCNKCATECKAMLAVAA